MELRHLTMNAHLGSINICACDYLFVCGPKFTTSPGNFGEDIPTSPEVIEAHTLIFKPNFKFSRLKLGGTPSPLGGVLGSLGQSLVR